MIVDLQAYDRVAAPDITHRLVPARFPPVAAFEDVTAADDLAQVMELEGWTDDRLSAPRLAQLDRDEWVFGRPNASVVMSAFLHGGPSGMRFSGPELGAWYAATERTTSVLEVANGLRREIALSALPRMTVAYRDYTARLGGDYLDIFGLHPEFHDPATSGTAASRAFGRAVRDGGTGRAVSGLRYESVRHPGHENWVCYRPRQVREVAAAGHFEIDVPLTGRVIVRDLERGT